MMKLKGESKLTFPEVLQEVVCGVCRATGSSGPDPLQKTVTDFCKATDPNSFNADLVSVIEGIRLLSFEAEDCQAANDELAAIWDTCVKFIMMKWTGDATTLTKDASWDCNTTLGVMALHAFFTVR